MLDNPTFWNKIGITLDKCTRYDKMVEVSRIWLSRAKNIPCFIDINLFVPSHALLTNRHPLWQHYTNKNIVRDLISPHKCKSLDVAFANYHLHDLLQLSDEKLSCIELLRFLYVHDENNRETVLPLDLHKLSNLTSLSLAPNLSCFASMAPPSTEYQHFEIFSGMPWHQLRHIHLDVELTALRCLDILKTSSPVLETCSLIVLEDLSFVFSPPSQIKPVYCPQLRRLTVHIYSNIMLNDGDSFILCLRLPKLKSFTLLCPYNSKVPMNPRTLCRMPSVCSMGLEELKIYDCDCEVDAGALLASMPSLRCFEVPHKAMFTVDVIRKIGTGSIGPLLEELTIDKCEISNEIGELIQMVKMRSSVQVGAREKITPTPFRSVLLYCEDPDGSLIQEYDAAINEINQLGVKLTVKFLGSSFHGEW